MDASAERIKSDYEAVQYVGQAFRDSHPDNVAVRAALAGYSTPPVDGCRVLEIGCACGANLLPMAASIPNGRLLGLDLSPSQIERGRAIVTAAGLANIELRCEDLRDFDATVDGPFDYVIAHGVYSWVPPDVRDRLLAVCAKALSPTGVAYVSYNVLPGWHLKRIARELAEFHIGSETDPRTRLKLAREAIAFAGQLVAPNTDPADPVYAAVARANAVFTESQSDWHLAHEQLEAANDAVYFRQFAAHAESHGLKHVTEARNLADAYHRLSATAKASVDRLAGSQADREQYVDFLVGQSFRRSIVCRADRAPDGPTGADAVPGFSAAALIRENPTGSGTFVGQKNGATLRIAHPGAAAAFRRLQNAWPASVPFADLMSAGPVDAATLVQLLVTSYAMDVVEFWSRGTGFIKAGANLNRPHAHGVTRAQFAAGLPVVSLRHEMLTVDPAMTHILPLLDGRRSSRQLGADIARAVSTGRLPASQLAAFGDWSHGRVGNVDALIRTLADLSLLTPATPHADVADLVFDSVVADAAPRVLGCFALELFGPRTIIRTSMDTAV